MCYEIIEIELAESLPALSINFGQLEMIFDKISTLWQIGGEKKGVHPLATTRDAGEKEYLFWLRFWFSMDSGFGLVLNYVFYF